MGGKGEDKVTQSKSADKLGGEIGKDLRFHESKGEIHFHDDQIKLKVAVPTATWFSAWQKVASSMGDWSYIDPKEKTILNVKVFQKRDKISVNINVQEIKCDDVYEKLQKFTSGN